MKAVRVLILTATLILFTLPQLLVSAQFSQVQCGNIIESEFTRTKEIHRYSITLSPGDQLTVTGNPKKNDLNMGMALLGPGNIVLAGLPGNSVSNGFAGVYVSSNPSPQIATGTLSVYGNYTILVSNADFGVDINGVNPSTDRGTGGYILSVGCTLQGIPIPPGSDTPSINPSNPQTVALTEPVIRGRSLMALGCGSTLTTEFTNIAELHTYTIEMGPEDKSFMVTVQPFGDYLKTILVVKDPSEKVIAQTRISTSPVGEAIISSTGQYKVIVANRDFDTFGNFPGYTIGGLGIYTVFVSCVTMDGRIINPADNLATIPTPQATASDSGSTLIFDTSSVDLANAIKIPLINATPMVGAIGPDGSQIYGFTLDANAGDIFDITVTRISGNLNLGVVVLSSDNKVVFYGGLITSESLSTRLTLPSAGQYTIGIFRVDLLPPDAPQATAFQVTGTLNP